MESENNQLNLLKERMPFDENTYLDYLHYEKALTRILDDSKYIALSLRFPYEDFTDYKLPKKYYNWQLRCCEELYKLIGSSNIISYSENGLSWTRDTGSLSDSLINEIEPKVGVVRKETEDV